MPDVVKHAWTHRPRDQGGTDPLNIEIPGGIVSHFPRHPIHCTTLSDGHTEWPGGVVVIEATEFNVAGTPTTDATNNYSSQSFLRYTTANSTWGAASNLIVIDPGAINLMDGHAYAIYYQYRLDATASGVKVGWTSADDTPTLIEQNLPASSPSNVWFSIGRIASTTTGVGVVRHGTNIELRAYKATGTVRIDIDQIIFVPAGYQEGSPGVGFDPGTFDTLVRFPDVGSNLSATAAQEFPDLTNWFEQSLSDTQTINSVLDPNFRWSATGWTNGFQPSPQGSSETDSFAWEAGHGRHWYVCARIQGESGELETAFFTAGAITLGANGMPHDSALLWNNSWQLVYMGPHSGSHEYHHLAGWVIAADPGGNEAPFGDDDGASTVAEVRMGPILQVTCLYDPQGC